MNTESETIRKPFLALSFDMLWRDSLLDHDSLLNWVGSKRYDLDIDREEQRIDNRGMAVTCRVTSVTLSNVGYLTDPRSSSAHLIMAARRNVHPDGRVSHWIIVSGKVPDNNGSIQVVYGEDGIKIVNYSGRTSLWAKELMKNPNFRAGEVLIDSLPGRINPLATMEAFLAQAQSGDYQIPQLILN